MVLSLFLSSRMQGFVVSGWPSVFFVSGDRKVTLFDDRRTEAALMEFVYKLHDPDLAAATLAGRDEL